jgi:hypothetical protein
MGGIRRKKERGVYWPRAAPLVFFDTVHLMYRREFLYLKRRGSRFPRKYSPT